MLRLIHSFDVKQGVNEESFVEWLDSELWERSKPFGCLERTMEDHLDPLGNHAAAQGPRRYQQHET